MCLFVYFWTHIIAVCFMFSLYAVLCLKCKKSKISTNANVNTDLLSSCSDDFVQGVVKWKWDYECAQVRTLCHYIFQNSFIYLELLYSELQCYLFASNRTKTTGITSACLLSVIGKTGQHYNTLIRVKHEYSGFVANRNYVSYMYIEYESIVTFSFNGVYLTY